MKKSLLAAATLALATLAAPEVARAGVRFSVGIGFPFPPVAVVAPPPCCGPVYYAGPVYGPPVYYGPRYYGVRSYVGPRYYKRYWRRHRWNGWHD